MTGAVTWPQPTGVPEVDLEVDVGRPLPWLPLDVYQNLTSAGLITSELFPFSVFVSACLTLSSKLSLSASYSLSHWISHYFLFPFE